MSISKAQYNASKKYQQKVYDRYSIVIKKDISNNLQNYLTENNISRNEYIVNAIIREHEKYMEGLTRNLYIPRWI